MRGISSGVSLTNVLLSMTPPCWLVSWRLMRSTTRPLAWAANSLSPCTAPIHGSGSKSTMTDRLRLLMRARTIGLVNLGWVRLYWGELVTLRGQDQGRSALRRQVGVDDQHGSSPRRGGAEVQATVDGGGCLPLHEISAGYPANLSQVRRNDSRARVLLLPRAAVTQGTGGPFSTQGVETGMGRRDPGSGKHR